LGVTLQVGLFAVHGSLLHPRPTAELTEGNHSRIVQRNKISSLEDQTGF